MWEEAVLIVVSCVLAIQMGLVGAVERVLRVKFRILSCPKCLTFWVSLGWHLFHGRPLLDSLAVSFLSSYIALWGVLIYDTLATIYNWLYEEIQETGGVDEGAGSEEDNQEEITDADKVEPSTGSNAVS